MNAGIFGKRPAPADVPLTIRQEGSGSSNVIDRLSMLLEIDPDGGRVGEAKRQARPAAIALVSFAAVNNVGVVNRQVPRLQFERNGS